MESLAQILLSACQEKAVWVVNVVQILLDLDVDGKKNVIMVP